MNILHYFLGLPPLHGGGLMIYARDLAFEQRKSGNKVFMLFPGVYKEKAKFSQIKFYKKVNQIELYQIVNPQPVSLSGIVNPKEFIKPKHRNDFKDFLQENKIDVLHVHSLIGLPKELVEEAKKLNRKTIFTVHDYFGLCPKISLFNYDNKVCYDYKSGRECVRCNRPSTNLKQLEKQLLQRNLIVLSSSFISNRITFSLAKLVHNAAKKILNSYVKKNSLENTVRDLDYVADASDYVEFRQYYLQFIEWFDLVIFNSEVTKETFSRYLDLAKINNKVISVTHSRIADNRRVFSYEPIKDGKINFVYLGYLDYRKGFFDLIEVLEEVRKEHTNWELHIYGDYSHLNIQRYNNRFYKFHGKYSHESFAEIFSNSSVLLIPSKWKETFGFIGLEAYSWGIPSIASENVGFSMVINQSKGGMVYSESDDNFGLKSSILAVLSKPQLLYELNQRILEDEHFQNYLMENHVKRITECYEELLEENT